MDQKPTLCVVGLGYVGLPVAHAFAKASYPTIGYDISTERIDELKRGHDRTEELAADEVRSSTIQFTTDPSDISKADIVIMAIPSPVDSNNKPDLALIESATMTVGKHLKPGMIVVYESTVYPGVTEEICGPILERESGLKSGTDFTLGYSPERINPGSRMLSPDSPDSNRTIETIIKIVSGQDEKTLNTLADLYGSIVKAGIHKAPSIKVAEMAKAIENAQRDLNIAFVNEVAMLCNAIGIPTTDVLKAAATKWNFLKFSPGLVGGHCIGVDPYYLVEKARQLNMQTHVITAGRFTNDNIATHVAHTVMAAMNGPLTSKRVLVLGLTFKPNVPDTRNSKSKDVVAHLAASGCQVDVHDPWLNDEAIAKQNMTPGSLKQQDTYDAIVLLVPHKDYLEMPLADFVAAVKPDGVIYDLKSVLDRAEVEKAGRKYLAL